MRSPLRTFTVRTRLSLWLALAFAGVVGLLAVATVALVHNDMRTAVFALQQALIDSASDDIEAKVQIRLDALNAASEAFDPAQFADVSRVRSRLGDRHALASLFDALFVSDTGGNLLAMSPQPDALLPSIADRSYFQQVLATGRAVVSEPLRGRATGRPAVIFAVPIHDERHATIGVLCGILALDKALAGFRGTVQSVDKDGAEAIHSFRALASAPWLVAAVYPTDEAYAPINRRVVDIVVGAALMSVLATFLLRWILRRELEPLGRLRNNMNEAANGRETDVDDDCAAADLRLLLRMHNRLKRLRAEAEAAQVEVERRLRDITDHVPALISVFDTGGRYIFANAHFNVVLGLSPELLVGRPLAEVREPSYVEQIERRMATALTGEQVTFESHLTVDTDPRVFQETYVPRRDADGAVVGLYAVTFDITERHRGRARLALAERRLRAVTDHLPAIVLYVDAEERYGFANRHAQDLLGSGEAVVGRTVSDVHGAERYPGIRPWIERAMRGETVEFEGTLPIRGDERTFHCHYVPELVEGSVCGFFALLFDITAMRVAERQLQLLARVDTLTGIANRRAFDERLEEAMARCRRSRRPMGLIFLDVDHFKRINDSLGHAGGDTVLKTFAARITASIRNTDLAARLAGDEFVVVLESLNDRSEAALVATKVLAAIRQPMGVAGRRLVVTSSLGVVYYDGAGETTADDLVARADRALYRGKQAGRDTFAETTL